jgi:hypothetical protein
MLACEPWTIDEFTNKRDRAMKPFLSFVSCGAFLLIAALFLFPALRGEQPAAMRIAAPELNDVEEWINTKPLLLKDLRGKVVALHFWTFG